METKKLTAKDLMIGDLVCYCKENNYLTKVESIHNTGHASVSDEYCIKCFRDRKDPLYDKNPIDFFNVEILHPIPLTAEILEKNFERDEYDGYSYYEINDEFCIRNAYDRIFLAQWIDSEWSLLQYPNFIIDLESVDQLQHVLRILNTDKEIVL